MYIVLRNSLGCEIDRRQVFHDENIQEALLKFIVNHDINVGNKYEVVDNEVEELINLSRNARIARQHRS